MFRLHDAQQLIEVQQLKNIQHFGFASEEEREAKKRELLRRETRRPEENNKTTRGGGEGGSPSSERKRQERAHVLQRQIRDVERAMEGMRARGVGPRPSLLPTIGGASRRDRGGADGRVTKSVSFYNPITSMGTSLASGGSLHSRSAIRVAAGASAVTVLGDLRNELLAERDRLSGILGVAPGLAPLRIEPHASSSPSSSSSIKAPREFRLFLGAPRELSHASAASASFAATRAKAAEQRELNLWLDALCAQMSRSHVRQHHHHHHHHRHPGSIAAKRYPAMSMMDTPKPQPKATVDTSPIRPLHQDHLHLLPSESRLFFPAR